MQVIGTSCSFSYNYTQKPERVPFVITYNPALCSISSIIRKHFNILTSSPRCHNVFKSIPLVAFGRSSNLKNYLVRAKLHDPTAQQNQPRGSYRRANREPKEARF